MDGLFICGTYLALTLGAAFALPLGVWWLFTKIPALKPQLRLWCLSFLSATLLSLSLTYAWVTIPMILIPTALSEANHQGSTPTDTGLLISEALVQGALPPSLRGPCWWFKESDCAFAQAVAVDMWDVNDNMMPAVWAALAICALGNGFIAFWRTRAKPPAEAPPPPKSK